MPAFCLGARTGDLDLRLAFNEKAKPLFKISAAAGSGFGM